MPKQRKERVYTYFLHSLVSVMTARFSLQTLLGYTSMRPFQLPSLEPDHRLDVPSRRFYQNSAATSVHVDIIKKHP